MTARSSGWCPIVLGDICEFRYGRSLPKDARKAGPYRVYGSNGQVGLHNAALTDGPTIIIGRKGSIGEVSYSSEGCWPIDTTYYVDRTCTDQHIPWLSGALAQLRLPEFNKSAAVPGLNRDDAYRRPLLLPPVSEQRRIATILGQADELREKRHFGLEQLDVLTQSVFYDLFGDPVTNSRQWPQTSLKSFFLFRTGKLDSNAAVPSGQFPFFTCAREDFRIDTYAFDCEALLLAGNNANAEYSVINLPRIDAMTDGIC